MMFCTRCGEKISDVSAFCTKCGSRTGNTVPVRPTEPVYQSVNPEPVYRTIPAPAPKKTNPLVVILAIAAVIVVLVFLFGGAYDPGDDPETLAYESYSIAAQLLDAVFDPRLANELSRKQAVIDEKVSRMSEDDRAVYEKTLGILVVGGVVNTLLE